MARVRPGGVAPLDQRGLRLAGLMITVVRHRLPGHPTVGSLGGQNRA